MAIFFLYMSVMFFFLDAFSIDPQRFTTIPLLVKIYKLIINELSSVIEANATRQTEEEWAQGNGGKISAVSAIGTICDLLPLCARGVPSDTF